MSSLQVHNNNLKLASRIVLETLVRLHLYLPTWTKHGVGFSTRCRAICKEACIEALYTHICIKYRDRDMVVRTYGGINPTSSNAE